MKRARREGFIVESRRIGNHILIPRYYDPRIKDALEQLCEDYTLIDIKSCVQAKYIKHSHGDYVPKIHYGTGPYPYVRTSDLANWEIKASPKHGVPKDVYEDYASEQAVCPGDILFVHEGTYLIGTVSMVTPFDGPMLYQHHLAKLAVSDVSPFSAFYLLAVLGSPLVDMQVRSKQFSADIIDSVVGRLEEIVIPIPRSATRLRSIEKVVREAVLGRAQLREQIAYAGTQIDCWLNNSTRMGLESICEWSPTPATRRETSFLGGRRGFSATALQSKHVVNHILLPKYYDPVIAQSTKEYVGRCEVRTVAEMMSEGWLTVDTGDEIGRINQNP